MSLFEDTNPRELKQLLSQIHHGDAALPDFQRDFVWDPNATQELVVSIAANYPAGSLLRIRNTHSLFACREFQGSPPLNGQRPTYLVLDGQQRLTSLYQAFYGVGDHRYYVNLRQLLDGSEFEECIFHLRVNTSRARTLAEFTTQADELVLPLSILKGGAGEFGRWTRGVARRTKSEEERVELEDNLSTIEERWIRTIDDYRFPVVTLSDDTSADAVCTIFETLNRTGVKLSAFELLTARFWPKNVNLRQLWSTAQERRPIISDFGIDPYYLLQIVALVTSRTPACQRSVVLDLQSSQIEEWWDRVVDGLADGLELLRDDCGVIVPWWLPYNPIVLALGAVLAKQPAVKGPAQGVVRQKLARWFWCSVFGQTYENAANSQAGKDTAELQRWLDGGDPPAAVTEFRFDPMLLRDTTARQRAIYRGAICLILRRGPRDFHNQRRITGDLITEQRIDDHHIFPYSYLGELGVPDRVRNSVLNRTLIDRPTNIRISNRPPSVYLREIRDAIGYESLDSILASHLLPTGLESPLWSDDIDSFLEWRQAALWNEIREVTGVSQASVLIDVDAGGQ